MAGSFAGALADTYGRKKMCVMYAVFYAVSCLVKLVNNYYILMVSSLVRFASCPLRPSVWPGVRKPPGLNECMRTHPCRSDLTRHTHTHIFPRTHTRKQFGRFFAGVATSLLFSSFEAWMVCEHNKRGFPNAWLSETFGFLTLGNGFVAGEYEYGRSARYDPVVCPAPKPTQPLPPSLNERTNERTVLAGLVANFFAERYGYVGPFVFCLLPLSLVAVLASLWWPENYGDTKCRPEMALPKAWAYIRSNSSIIFLGLGQSCFEGAMYAFVFVWTPALQAGGQDVGPYLGVIFSTFMVS